MWQYSEQRNVKSWFKKHLSVVLQNSVVMCDPNKDACMSHRTQKVRKWNI